MSDDCVVVRIHGYAAATVHISRERWERERQDPDGIREWAQTQLKRHGQVTDATIISAEDEDGDYSDEVEW